MKISADVHQALTVMLDLAMQCGSESLPPGTGRWPLSAEDGTTGVVWRLAAAGLVMVAPDGHSIRLGREPETIALSDIFEAVAGPLCIVDCLAGGAGCGDRRECVAQTIWSRINREIFRVMQNINLREMLQMEAERSLWAVSEPAAREPEEMENRPFTP